MKKLSTKRLLFMLISSLFILSIIIMLALGPRRVYNKVKSIVSTEDAAPPTGESSEPLLGAYSPSVMFDGDHFKLKHPIIKVNGHVHISVPDLQDIADVRVEQFDDVNIKLFYRDDTFMYENGEVIEDDMGSNDILTYHIEDGVMYVPDRHIEKFFAIDVDFYLRESTKTVSLSSPDEQIIPKHDQQIGTTVFLERHNVPLELYEPRGGAYLGAYVLQDEFINQSMETFADLTQKEHASYFKYVGYGEPFPTEWVDEVVSLGGFPHIAFEPNDGLEEVKDDDYLRQFAKEAGSYDTPILLRYASEMNGTWTHYSGNEKLYIDKWKLVHSVFKEEAPNTMMLWNVFTMPESTITDFYPGDDYVDYVGVNIYNVIYHHNLLHERSDFEDPLRLLDYVYNTYSARKPIIIGEFGATNYTVTDGLHYVDFAIDKITRLYKYIPELYPRVKGIYYFDVNNLVNAPRDRRINNYAITENERITHAYAKQVNDPFYLSSVQDNPSNQELYSFRDFLFFYDNVLFVDTSFVESFLNIKVNETDDDEVKLTLDDQSHMIRTEELTIDKAGFNEKRDLVGVPLLRVLELFGFDYVFQDDDLYITE